VTTKKEEGSIAFAIMEEAATGRPSIYVPKNIFVAGECGQLKHVVPLTTDPIE
jgi:hypothetical protein